MRRYRTIDGVKQKIDTMVRKGEVILDHGIGSYEFSGYSYEKPGFDNGFEAKLHIYYRDFDANKMEWTRLYMTLTDNNLRKPRKDRWGDYERGEFVDCHWEKEYPSLLYMREYEAWR